MSKCIAPLSGDEFYADLSLVVPERDSHYDFFCLCNGLFDTSYFRILYVLIDFYILTLLSGCNL